MLKGFQNEVKMDAEINGYRKERSNNMPKSPKYHQNGDQNRRKVEVAFLKRFWNGPWAVSGILEAIFDQKSPKRHEKRHAKFDIEKGREKYRFLRGPGNPESSILGAIFDEKSKKGIQKGIQNSMPKKYRKMIPKLCEIDTKMDAKIY